MIKYTLKTHRFIHSGEKRVCQGCGTENYFKGNLIRYLKAATQSVARVSLSDEDYNIWLFFFPEASGTNDYSGIAILLLQLS